MALARKSSDRFTEETTLGNLGAAYQTIYQHQQAIACFEQQLAIAQEIGDQRGEANALMDLGNSYSYLGNPWQAIDYYDQAAAIFRATENRRGEGQVLGNLGNAYAGLASRAKPSNITNEIWQLPARSATARVKDRRWGISARHTKIWGINSVR